MQNNSTNGLDPRGRERRSGPDHRSGVTASRRRFLAAGSGAALAATAGCLSMLRDDGDVVTFGTLPIAAVAEIHLAEERGYFEDRGIDLEIERITGAPQAVPQLASGELDVASGSIGASIFNSIAQDVPVQIVADQTQWWENQPSGNRIWVREELYSDGMALSDVEGTPTVAINGEGGSMDYVVGRLLASEGMGWADIEITEMPFPDMIGAMAGGEIDLCSIPDPLGLQVASEANAGQLLYGSEVAPRMQIAGYFYGQPFIEERPAVARRWLEAYLLGVREYYEMGGFPDEELAGIISDAIDVPVGAIRSSIPSLPHKNGFVNVDSIMRQQEYHACRGYVDETVEAEAIVNESILDEALAEVGRLDEAEATPSVANIEEWSESAPAPYPPLGDMTPPSEFPTDAICE